MPQRTRIRKAAFGVLRTRPREVAFQLLYQDDLNPGLEASVSDQQIEERLPLQAFVESEPDELLEDERDAGEPLRLAPPGLANVSRDELTALAREFVAEFSVDELNRLTREELTTLVCNNAMQFARSLVAGVREYREELDGLIEQAAENWSLSRMAATDRNVLRLGAYELLHTNTPDRVAVDEAVELAKRFGTSQSGPFVNGILDRLMRGKGETPPA